MEIKVIRDFCDREDGLQLKKKDALLTVTTQRGQYLIEQGFAKEATENAKKKPKA